MPFSFDLLFNVLAFLFMIGSVVGWGIELLFRRFFTAKKWINPGFLTGPYLPLYGFGVAILYLICSIDYTFLPFSFLSNQIAKDLFVILLIGVVMTVLELLAGLIFIEGMHIRLWDYRDRFLNYKGIICPLFSFFWTIAGAFFYYLIQPYLAESVTWLLQNFYFIFFVGMFFGVLLVDFSIAMNLSVKLKKMARENRIIIGFEKLKESIREELRKENIKGKFAFPFKSPVALKDHVIQYIEKNKEAAKQKAKKK